jgi:hypothetical protein
MPCYTAWNQYLQEGTPEYDRARAVVQARFLAVKHIVGYYYAAAGVSLPQIPLSAKAEAIRVPKSEKERRIWKAIAHHCACDGNHFCTLYDVCSLLDGESARDRSYERVILGCAHLMEAHTTVYRIAEPTDEKRPP